MADAGPKGEATAVGPPPEAIESIFAVSEVRQEGPRTIYLGEPRVEPESVIKECWPRFRAAGYEPSLTRRGGEYALVAEPADPGINGIPWTNLVLFCLTVASTLFAGAMWYHLDPISEPTAVWQAWPFAAAILFVLGVHEMGHYLASRYYGVQASLPYFLPVPTLIGTMGAVITLEGRMPNRRALFDIGVAGPLAGLVAAVAVTAVGLHLPPVHAPEELVGSPDAVSIHLGFPPLLEGLAAALDQPLYRDDPGVTVNPVVIAGWVGMLVTFLNLIPVGQLDGGHILRAMLGPPQEAVGVLVPGLLFVLAGYLHYRLGHGGSAVAIWVVWGLLAALLAAAGPARPVYEDTLGLGRHVLGVVTFGLGALCFMPVPVAIVG